MAEDFLTLVSHDETAEGVRQLSRESMGEEGRWETRESEDEDEGEDEVDPPLEGAADGETRDDDSDPSPVPTPTLPPNLVTLSPITDSLSKASLASGHSKQIAASRRTSSSYSASVTIGEEVV